MKIELFIVIGIFMALPDLIIAVSELKISKKYSDYQAVKVSRILFFICCGAVFVAIFAFLSNLYEYINFGDNLLWFIIMMGIVYLGMNVCLFIMYREKIFYSKETNNIILIKHFKKIKAKRNEITRFNLSDEYIDFYFGEKRIRYGNNFLIGTLELHDYMKK